MIKSTRTMLVFTAIFMAILSAAAQPSVATGQATLEAFHRKDFAAALAQGQTLLAQDDRRVDALFICGESARQLGFLQQAEGYLEKIPHASKKGLYAATDLRLAGLKSALGKCNEARTFFYNYLDMFPDTNDLFVQQVQAQLADCHPIKKEKAVAVKSSLAEISLLAENVNTPASELAPLRYADKIYFTSTVTNGKNGRPVSRLFTAIRDEKAVPLEVNPREDAMQAAHTALNANASRIYYSQYKDDRSGDAPLWELWCRDRNYDGSWGPPKRLPRHVNMPGFAASQPATGFDLNLKKEMLFFATDRPGGKGKWDIWACTVEPNDAFGEPFCLSFNTPDDEMSPFFQPIGQTLYFSANGPQSVGGFDIFKTEKNAAGDWNLPQNLQVPINSVHDELYLTFHSNSGLFYFSSNRPNERCKSASDTVCNFDIYAARLNVGMEIQIFNAQDSTALSGANVELMDLATGAIDTTCVALDGNHSTLILTPGKSYRLIVSLPDYFPVFKELNTLRAGVDARMEERIYLKSMRTPPAAEAAPAEVKPDVPATEPTHQDRR